MKIAIELINWAIGGTEKRFPNLLRYLIGNTEHDYKLIINRHLISLLDAFNHLNGLDEIICEVPPDKGRFSRFIDTPEKQKNGFKHIKHFHSQVINRMKKTIRPWLYNTKGANWHKDIDILHITLANWWPNIAPKGIPCIIEAQGVRIDGKYANMHIKKLIADENNVVNCASDRIRAMLLKKFSPINSQRFFVSPCSFIDYSKTRIEAKENIVAFLGRFIEEKNPLLFLDAIRHVIKKVNTVKFFLIGNGKLEKKIVEYIANYGLKNYVEVGFMSSPVDLLAKSLIAVSIQNNDNYHSQALMEEMACGCAIVASDMGETDKLVNDKVGFRVPLNAESIAEKIVWLLKNKNTAEKMGLEARKKVMEEQTVERYANYLEEMYKFAHTRFQKN